MASVVHKLSSFFPCFIFISFNFKKKVSRILPSFRHCLTLKHVIIFIILFL